MAAVDLWWLPLGAGGHSVKYNGRVFEALVARREGRRAMDLYHAALEVEVGGIRRLIEVAPVPDGDGAERGVAVEGPVGARWAGRFRVFRYEVRCWSDGELPDRRWAVDSPRRLSDDEGVAARLLAAVPDVPADVWGRDRLGAGDMWNSNSVVAWLLVRAGIDAAAITPPAGGRAPGWRAGLVAAGAHPAR